MILKRKKGMTLVEVIVAIAILGIIAVSFLGIFTQSFSTIFDFGRKSKTLMEAHSIMDKIYENSNVNNYIFTTDVQGMISDLLIDEGYALSDFKLSTSLDLIATRESLEHVRYYVGTESNQSGIVGFPVTVLVFHSDNKRNVILTTFIVKGGS